MNHGLPGLEEIRRAAELVSRTMPPTPQYRRPLLGTRAGAEVWVRHENHSPVGALQDSRRPRLYGLAAPRASRGHNRRHRDPRKSWPVDRARSLRPAESAPSSWCHADTAISIPRSSRGCSRVPNAPEECRRGSLRTARGGEVNEKTNLLFYRKPGRNSLRRRALPYNRDSPSGTVGA
jgi:hypothetical protein